MTEQIAQFVIVLGGCMCASWISYRWGFRDGFWRAIDLRRQADLELKRAFIRADQEDGKEAD
jgi:hypothetical protein